MTAAPLWTHTEATRRTHRLNTACLTCPRTEECVARIWQDCPYAEPTPPEMTPATMEEAGTYSPREAL